MLIKVIVAGCRNYNNYEEAKSIIDFYLSKICINNEIVILSGGCRGADSLGEKYASEKNYKIERHQANWGKYGKKAGPIRNEKMASLCDFVICFWDGKSKGTKNMIAFAKKYNKPLRVKIIKRLG